MTIYCTIITTDNIGANEMLGKDGVPSNHFTTGLSTNGELPATHYIASGGFEEEELNILLNSNINKKVIFGEEANLILQNENLKIINEL